MSEEQRYKTLNEFFGKNSGLLSVLSIFLIFLSVSGKDFLPELNYGIKLSALSEFLWFAGMLIVVVCLITLVKESWIKNNPKSIKAFGSVLFLALFCTIMYLFFAVLLSENILLIFKNLPSSLPIAILVMASPFIFVLIKKIDIKWIHWVVYLIVPILALSFLLFNLGVQNWSNKLVAKNPLYWFAFAIIISFIWSLYYKISDWKSKKKE